VFLPSSPNFLHQIVKLEFFVKDVSYLTKNMAPRKTGVLLLATSIGVTGIKSKPKVTYGFAKWQPPTDNPKVLAERKAERERKKQAENLKKNQERDAKLKERRKDADSQKMLLEYASYADRKWNKMNDNFQNKPSSSRLRNFFKRQRKTQINLTSILRPDLTFQLPIQWKTIKIDHQEEQLKKQYGIDPKTVLHTLIQRPNLNPISHVLDKPIDYELALYIKAKDIVYYSKSNFVSREWKEIWHGRYFEELAENVAEGVHEVSKKLVAKFGQNSNPDIFYNIPIVIDFDGLKNPYLDEPENPKSNEPYNAKQLIEFADKVRHSLKELKKTADSPKTPADEAAFLAAEEARLREEELEEERAILFGKTSTKTSQKNKQAQISALYAINANNAYKRTIPYKKTGGQWLPWKKSVTDDREQWKTSVDENFNAWASEDQNYEFLCTSAREREECKGVHSAPLISSSVPVFNPVTQKYEHFATPIVRMVTVLSPQISRIEWAPVAGPRTKKQNVIQGMEWRILMLPTLTLPTALFGKNHQIKTKSEPLLYFKANDFETILARAEKVQKQQKGSQSMPLQKLWRKFKLAGKTPMQRRFHKLDQEDDQMTALRTLIKKATSSDDSNDKKTSSYSFAIDFDGFSDKEGKRLSKLFYFLAQVMGNDPSPEPKFYSLKNIYTINRQTEYDAGSVLAFPSMMQESKNFLKKKQNETENEKKQRKLNKRKAFETRKLEFERRRCALEKKREEHLEVMWRQKKSTREGSLNKDLSLVIYEKNLREKKVVADRCSEKYFGTLQKSIDSIEEKLRILGPQLTPVATTNDVIGMEWKTLMLQEKEKSEPLLYLKAEKFEKILARAEKQQPLKNFLAKKLKFASTPPTNPEQEADQMAALERLIRLSVMKQAASKATESTASTSNDNKEFLFSYSFVIDFEGFSDNDGSRLKRLFYFLGKVMGKKKEDSFQENKKTVTTVLTKIRTINRQVEYDARNVLALFKQKLNALEDKKSTENLDDEKLKFEKKECSLEENRIDYLERVYYGKDKNPQNVNNVYLEIYEKNLTDECKKFRPEGEEATSEQSA